jgi:hypothetical protein
MKDARRVLAKCLFNGSPNATIASVIRLGIPECENQIGASDWRSLSICGLPERH